MPRRETLWQVPDAEPELARFQVWTGRYLAAAVADRPALENEGVELARQRLAVLAGWVISHPEKALQQVMPSAVRRALPAAVQALLEEPVNGVGDYEVLCVLGIPGQPGAAGFTVRNARISGRAYQVFTHGLGLEYVTRSQVPLNGVAVPVSAAAAVPANPMGQPDALLALDPSPMRVLDGAEQADYAGMQPSEPLCQVTGQPWTATGEPVALALGGTIVPFCGIPAAKEWTAKTMADLALNKPRPKELPVGTSSYTVGRKRFILYRVDFPDYAGEVMSTNQALTLMTNFATFDAEMSWGRFIVAPVGEGSDITPTMRLPGNVATYENMGTLLDACRTAATALGYNIGQYDFQFVCTSGKPNATFAGLGYEGAVGYWLANRYWDVRTCAHEHGHNLGLGHANYWNTGGSSAIGGGSNEEYGDPFDTMGGSGGSPRHYNSCYKYKLGWIPNADCPIISASGTNRLYALDSTVPTGVRSLRVNRSTGSPYWLEFRQRWTSNKALMNGVGVRWDSGRSLLLDTTPGSSGGKDDHPVVIGRTFSEPAANVHITPIGKGNTFPESLDVVVNLGSFPGNVPPTLRVSADRVQAATGQDIRFEAAGADDNGDTLAWYWEFGDGDYSVDNQPVAVRSYSTAGDYLVQCTVSDMRGGVARQSLLVRVGSPSTFGISGRILNTKGLPVSGVRVCIDASKYAFTEDDGTYTLPRLAAGSYTVQAMEPLLGTATFLRPFFNNPVAVGPSVTNADFIQWPSSLSFYTPFVSRSNDWRYLDTGVYPGTNWMTAAYNDSGWSNGTAILGYGEGNETTIIGYGDVNTNKYPTYYFRRAFTVSNPAAFTNLLLEVLRDDGAVAYLNGVEVFRNNLPTGAVTQVTRALQAVEPTAYIATNLPVGLLRTGYNLLAVEMHQVCADSSDLNFDAAISGLSVTNARALNLVYLSAPENGQRFTAPAAINLSAFAQSGAGPVSGVEFYTNGVRLAQDLATPFTAAWSGVPEGNYRLLAVATSGGVRSTSAPVDIHVTLPLAVTLITNGSAWRYLSGTNPAPADWKLASFIDNTWSNGLAELGYGDSSDGRAERTVIDGGPADSRYPTVYFRRDFVVGDPASIASLDLQLKRDDGVVVYFNGVEVLRDMLPAGVVNYSTLATNVPDDGSNFISFVLSPGDSLVPGTNIVAVEIHQSGLSSTDLSFDLRLNAAIRTNRARGIWLVAPASDTEVALPGSVDLVAEVVPGGTLGVRDVTFLAGCTPLGTASRPPFHLTWGMPPVGFSTLRAVATDSSGLSFTSAPVVIRVRVPDDRSALISFGDVWKYLDDGSDQGTDWTTAAFNDWGWMAGGGRLGYGGDGEVTTVNAGTNEFQRIITTYFRKWFVAPDPSQYSALLLQLVRDDGAVVYLNGHEVFRDNLRPGLVSFNSLASCNMGNADEDTPLMVELPLTWMQAGSNLMTVEIHQSNLASSDIGFDLALSGLAATNNPLALRLCAPAGGARFSSPAQVPLLGFVGGTACVQRLEFYAGSVRLGQVTNAPFSLSWFNPPTGSHQLTARAVMAGGIVLTSAPVAITVAASPPPIQPTQAILIPAEGAWKFWDAANGPGADWAHADYSDGAWPAGVARFGWGLDGESTPLTSGRVTHYFRRWFTVTNPAAFTELIVQLLRDDGAVVYLNGRELYRSNLPAGAITESTTASALVDAPDETTYFETVIPVPVSGLVAGSNLVAVELHQSSTSSGDAGFDLQLQGRGTTEGRIYFASPVAGSSCASTATLPVQVQFQLPAGRSLMRVELYADAAKLAELHDPPYSFAWEGPLPGTRQLLARLVDGTGARLDSAVLPVVVTPPASSALLVSSDSNWKYLDTGVYPGVNWNQVIFSTTDWKQGPARLGYGGDGEVTTIGYGTNANNKHITTYFRQSFVMPTSLTCTSLTFRLLRDDGAIVYLNGGEVFRSNMPTGAVTYLTTAPANVSGGEEQTFFTTQAGTNYLRAGNNVLAVELHQDASTSSDLGFALEVTANGYTLEPPAPTLTTGLSHSASGIQMFLPASGIQSPWPTGGIQLTWPTGGIQLTWPADALGWRVFASPDCQLPKEQWQPVDVTPVISGGWKTVTIQPGGTNWFFRLGRQ